jgi:hypothetical protein
MFEMKRVLRAVVGARRVTAIDAADEGYARRGVTFVPADDAPLLLPARTPARRSMVSTRRPAAGDRARR